MSKYSHKQFINDVVNEQSRLIKKIAKLEAKLATRKSELNTVTAAMPITSKEFSKRRIAEHIQSRHSLWKLSWLMSDNFIEWDSTNFWSAIPTNINAVAYDETDGIIKLYTQGFGHYSNYTDDYDGPELIQKSKRDSIKSRWYTSSIFEPVYTMTLDEFAVSHPKVTDNDGSRNIIYRPDIIKKQFDVSNIDWSLVPVCFDRVIISVRKHSHRQYDIQFSVDGYIDAYDNIQTGYELSDGTQPDRSAENYNYEFVNYPSKSNIIKRPKQPKHAV